jgi:hypothetical protein
MTKMCPYCKTEKPIDDFPKDKSKKDGAGSLCFVCRSIYRKKYYNQNADRLKKYSRDYHRENNQSEEHKKARSEYHKNRTPDLAKRRERHAKRYKSDVRYSANHKIRSMLKRCLAATGTEKACRTIDALGYSAEDLIKRIEVQMTDGMDWSNAGEWEIDHKIPIAIFVNRGETRPRIINALSNLQPLWKFDNRSKGARRVG